MQRHQDTVVGMSLYRLSIKGDVVTIPIHEPSSLQSVSLQLQTSAGTHSTHFQHLQDKQQKPVVLQHTNNRVLCYENVWVLTVKPLCGFTYLNVSQRSAVAAGRVLHVPAACCWIIATLRAAELQQALIEQEDKMQSVRADQHRFYRDVTPASPPDTPEIKLQSNERSVLPKIQSHTESIHTV